MVTYFQSFIKVLKRPHEYQVMANENDSLRNEIKILKAELEALKGWNKDASRYEMKRIGPDKTIVYRLREDHAKEGEISHCICAQCFVNREKLILGSKDISPLQRYTFGLSCPKCGILSESRQPFPV